MREKTSPRWAYPREWSSWLHMMQRCNNPNNDRYADYGGRGITVCTSWYEFENFYNSMGPRPEGTTLDRKDNDAGYYPDNCCWATPSQQQLSKGVQHNSVSGIKGVSYVARRKEWRARYTGHHLGWFKTKEEAIEARRKAEHF